MKGDANVAKNPTIVQMKRYTNKIDAKYKSQQRI